MMTHFTWFREMRGLVFLTVAPAALSAAENPATTLRVPKNVVVEEVASAPLVQYPLFACFDDRGRLFVAEGTGTNLPGTELVPLKRGKIRLLEDTDGDGKFDSGKIFADGLVFPQGVLWRDGALYVASHPSIWRLQDTNGDGVADKREELVGKFGFNGNGCDIHGPFSGPDGWLYWTDGRHGYRVQTREGEVLEGLAARIWRCRLDGTGIERIAGGPFDNPVELAFTETGDLIGTMDQGGPGDMLLHYIEGGVYPRGDHPTLKEFPMTGPLLEPLATYSPALPAALCGLVHLKSDHFGPDYKGTLMSAHFNLHRIEQHTLTRNGASFRVANNDFFVSTDTHLHLTDVLEDADGSLLAVDMGAWFNYGCPTLKIAQPHVTGKILRIRRQGAAAIADPWGKSLRVESMSATELIRLLGESRVKVRERATEALVKLGEPAVHPLAKLAQSDGQRSADAVLPSALRREALWILSRINSPAARTQVRAALADQDETVRHVALHCTSVERDAAALQALLRIVVNDEPQLRMKAAEALGRIGRREAVPALLASLRQVGADRALEHSVIYALIRIGDFDRTLEALSDPMPQVRRGVLIALDQMNGTEKPVPLPAGQEAATDNPYRGATFEYIGNAKLAREHVAPLLDTDDAVLQQTALQVISRHPGWADESIALATQWLQRPTLDMAQQHALTGTLLAFSDNAKIQHLVATTFQEPAVPVENRKLLFEVMARCRLEKLPAPWSTVIERTLRNVTSKGDPDGLGRAALEVIRSRKLSEFDGALAAIADRDGLPAELRVIAFACVATRTTVSGPRFAVLVNQLGPEAEPLLQMTAATALASAPLSRDQLVELTKHIPPAGPLVVRLLMPAFLKSDEASVGRALVTALQQSSGAGVLAASDVALLLKRYPPEVTAAAQSFLDPHFDQRAHQEKYLQELARQVVSHPGDLKRGEKVFLSREAGCYACHRIQEKGGQAGPDLSQIGRFRTREALLEAIAFPSSSIVPDFRPFVIETKSGESTLGMMARETADAIYLRTPQLAEVRIARHQIANITSPDISLMPEGLEKMLTPQQLSDLVEYLYQLR